MKRDLIRYITHEVRSPLNVIYSGVKMMITDIADSLKEKKDLLELATSVSVSCEDLLRTMNDILLMESLTSNTFNISKEITPCAEMPSMNDTTYWYHGEGKERQLCRQHRAPSSTRGWRILTTWW